MKKAFSMLLAMVLVFSLTACGGSNKASAPSNTTTTSETKTETTDATTDTKAEAPVAEAAVPDQKVTVTWLVTGDVPTNATDKVLAKLNELLLEKLNTELKISWIEWTDWSTKYNLALATQDGSIDLVGAGTDWLDTWQNIQKGAFLPLSEEMLKTYAPKTWASVSPENWELCKYNGEIYMFPEDNYAQWINHGFMYRGDWAKEAGLTSGVKSWIDMGTYFQYIKDNKPDVIPWDASGSGSSLAKQMASGWASSHTPNIVINGFPVEIFLGNSKDDPYTLSSYYVEGEELVNFAKMMKQWADAGYWREDVLNYSGDTRVEMEEGLTGADQHHTQTWTGERTRMNERQPGSDLQFFWWGEEMNNLIGMNITHGACTVAASSKNPERALMLYDYIRNDKEAYNLMNYGIEGQQYELTPEGYRKRPDGYVDETDGFGLNYWWGRNDDLEIKSAEVDWPAVDAQYAEYEKIATPFPYGRVVFDLTPISSQLDNLSNVCNTYLPQIAFGKAADPVAYVAEFREALKAAGYQQCVDEVQKQLDAVYKK